MYPPLDQELERQPIARDRLCKQTLLIHYFFFQFINYYPNLISLSCQFFTVTIFIDQDLGTGVDKKDEGDPSVEWNKGTLFAEMHAYISSIKWLCSH